MKQKMSVALVLSQVIGFALIFYTIRACWYVFAVSFSWLSVLALIVFVMIFIDIVKYVLIHKPKRLLCDSSTVPLATLKGQIMAYVYVSRCIPIWGVLYFPTALYRELEEAYNKRIADLSCCLLEEV